MKSIKYLGDRDYIQFCRCFGDNPELYEKLKSLKENAEVTWEEISNLKYSDVDLDKRTVVFR